MNAKKVACQLMAKLGRQISILAQRYGLSKEECIAAILTGYDSNLPDQTIDDPKSMGLPPAHVHLITSALFRWKNEPRYVDDDGSPITLPREGEGASIRTLIEECIEDSRIGAQEISVDSVLENFLASDALEQLADQRYRLIKTWFRINPESGPSTIKHLEWLVEFAESIAANIIRPGRGREVYVSRVQRFPKKKLPFVRSMINDDGLTFIENVNDYLEAERIASDSVEPTVHVGVGVYLFTKEEED